MEKVRYMISDAAAAVDVETHVLRYWEDELGLDVPRNELGHRYYTRDNIKQFLRIKELKEKGYQLRAIRDMLHSDAPGEPLNPPNPAAMEKSVQPVNYTNITNQTVKQEMSGIIRHITMNCRDTIIHIEAARQMSVWMSFAS